MLDRLSRNPKDTLYLLEDDVFEKNNTTFLSVQEPFVNTKDPTKAPTSKMFTTILTAFAQHESEMITERMKMGKYQKARLGNFPDGHILYPATGEFEINEEEARIINLIYYCYVCGDESGQPLWM